MGIPVNQREHAPPTGLDTEGHVYILCGDEPPDTKQITRMMTSKASMEESSSTSVRQMLETIKKDQKVYQFPEYCGKSMNNRSL